MQMFTQDELRQRYARMTKAELVDALINLEQNGSDTEEHLVKSSIFANAATEGILVHDQGRILEANPAAGILLNMETEALVGRGIYEYISGGWRERVSIESARVDGKPVEAIWLTSDGRAFQCECSNIRMQVEGQYFQALRFRRVRSQRQPLDERLRLAEEMWDLYNNTPCGYHSIDEKGLILRMNATELNWLGYEAPDVLGMMTLPDLLTPRSQEIFRQSFPVFKEQGLVRELELEFKRKDGSILPVLISATAVYDDNGNYIMSRTTVFEISELKRASQQLKESEEKFRAIAEQSLIGIFILQNGRMIYVNESLRQISGYSAQELFDLGEGGFQRLVHPDDQPIAERAISRLMLEGEKIAPRDLRGRHKNGETRWLELSASHVILRGIPSLFGMVADVTEKKQAELDRQEALSRTVRFQAAISKIATSDALIRGDLQKSLEEIASWTADAVQVTGTSIWLLSENGTSLSCEVHYCRDTQTHQRPGVSFDLETIADYFQELSQERAVVSHGQHASLPIIARGSESGELAILDAAIRLSGRVVGAFRAELRNNLRGWRPDEISFAGEVADQVAHAIMSHRRMAAETALRKAEAKNRALNIQLKARVKERTEQLSEVQGQLVQNARRAGIADIATSVLHNVGNILTSVITSGQTIEKTVATSSLKSMKKANGLLGETVDHEHPRAKALVDFYHTLEDLLSKEHFEINENVDLVLKKIDLIRDVITAQQSYASTHSHMEKVMMHEMVEDALHIQEHTLGNHDVTLEKHYEEAPSVFVPKIKVIHVLINLIKNASEAMRDKAEGERRIEIYVGPVANQVIVKITDHGIGIAKENLDKIFNHGFSTKKSGHGFGLHSCSEAMKELGGTIRAESPGLGMGASFILGFPVYDEDADIDFHGEVERKN